MLSSPSFNHANQGSDNVLIFESLAPSPSALFKQIKVQTISMPLIVAPSTTQWWIAAGLPAGGRRPFILSHAEGSRRHSLLEKRSAMAYIVFENPDHSITLQASCRRDAGATNPTPFP